MARAQHRIPSASAVLVLALLAGRSAGQPPAGRRAEPLAPPASPALDSPEGTLGYALGLRIGARMREDFVRQEAPLDFAAMAAGLADALAGRPPRVPEPRMVAAIDAFDARMRKRDEEIRRQLAERGKVHRAKAAEFLARNREAEGVVALPSGLQYRILAAGKGRRPAATDVVSAHFRGTHLDGREFDKSDPQRGPIVAPIEGLIRGWQEALPQMAVGSKWRLWVPAELAYGEEGSPPEIEPNELLVFDLELIGIEPPRSP